MKPKSILTAASILILLGACAQTDLNRIRGAGATAGGVRAANRVVSYPDDCRRVSRSGVTAGDRLDVALLKTDAALSRQNARTRRCADWYEQAHAPQTE